MVTISSNISRMQNYVPGTATAPTISGIKVSGPSQATSDIAEGAAVRVTLSQAAQNFIDAPKSVPAAQTLLRSPA